MTGNVALGGRGDCRHCVSEQGSLCVLTVAWLLFSWPAWSWVGRNLLNPHARLNLVLILAAAVVGGRRVWCWWGQRSHHHVCGVQTAKRAALLLLGLGAIVMAVGRWELGIHRVMVVGAGIGSCGVLGLWLDRRTWRRVWAPVALLVVAVPWADMLDIYAGFPLRSFTAGVVAKVFADVGVIASAENILVFENGIAHVDLPCSGIKSLWAGALLGLAVTWLDRRRLGWRWLLAHSAFVSLLVAANITRVTLLVLTGIVLGNPLLAEMIHVPVGIVAFSGASGILLLLLRNFVPESAKETPRSRPVSAVTTRTQVPRLYRLSTVGLTGLLLVAAFAIGPRRVAHAGPEPVTISLDPRWNVQTAPMSEAESSFFAQENALFSSKRAFRWNPETGPALGGSWLVLAGDSFRSHHLPDRCLEASGFEIAAKSIEVVDPDFPVQRVRLNTGNYQAVYWFQAADRITADYSERVWADMVGQRRWALVSILIRTDGRELSRHEVHPMLRSLREGVDAALGGDT